MTNKIKKALKERILVLDGAMGTALQSYKLSDSDFKGARFRDRSHNLEGNYDILCLTQPEIVLEVHNGYLDAGADIIETNSFNSSSISQEDYGTVDIVYELNRAAAKLARQAADVAAFADPTRPRFVAGAIGPTNRICTKSSDVKYPANRTVTFDRMRDAYAGQIRGLLDGGVDILLIETVFDACSVEAAIFAALDEFDKRGEKTPLWISGTLSKERGQSTTGMSLKAFWDSIHDAHPLIVGLNCALGPVMLSPYVKELAELADCYISIHPNAGLPNESGEYEVSPEDMATVLNELAVAGCLNIVGGCCGTTKKHIKAIADSIRENTPRQIIHI